MKKIFAFLAIVMLVICVGCGNSEVKSDLENYVKFQKEIDAELEATSGKSNHLFVTSSSLNDSIPTLLKVHEKQKQYKPKTKEVQEIHNKGIKIVDGTLDYCMAVRDEMDSDSVSTTKDDEIEKKERELKTLLASFEADLKKLAIKYNVKV